MSWTFSHISSLSISAVDLRSLYPSHTSAYREQIQVREGGVFLCLYKTGNLEVWRYQWRSSEQRTYSIRCKDPVFEVLRPPPVRVKATVDDEEHEAAWGLKKICITCGDDFYWGAIILNSWSQPLYWYSSWQKETTFLTWTQTRFCSSRPMIINSKSIYRVHRTFCENNFWWQQEHIHNLKKCVVIGLS